MTRSVSLDTLIYFMQYLQSYGSETYPSRMNKKFVYETSLKLLILGYVSFITKTLEQIIG